MFVYLIHCPSLDFYKIGVSKNINTRINQLQTGSPYPIELKKSFETDFAFKIESALHRRFSSKKTNIDNDAISGEWFNLSIQDVINFDETCKLIENNIIALKEAGNPFV